MKAEQKASICLLSLARPLAAALHGACVPHNLLCKPLALYTANINVWSQRNHAMLRCPCLPARSVPLTLARFCSYACASVCTDTPCCQHSTHDGTFAIMTVQVESLGQVLGAPAPPECVRAPADHAVVEGAFWVSRDLAPAVRATLLEQGVPQKALPPAGQGSRLDVRREVSPAADEK